MKMPFKSQNIRSLRNYSTILSNNCTHCKSVTWSAVPSAPLVASNWVVALEGVMIVTKEGGRASEGASEAAERAYEAAKKGSEGDERASESAERASEAAGRAS